MRQEFVSDAQLLQSIQKDDAAAFKVLYNRYWEGLYLKACQRVNRDEAKDMVQEVMTTLWRRRKVIVTRDDGNLSRYLYTAIKYRVISHYAYTLTEVSHHGIYDLPDKQAAATSLETKELGEFLEKEIKRLPARMQEIFRMSREDGFSIADIASRLHLSEQTIKNQLTEALKRLRASQVKNREWGVASGGQAAMSQY